MEKSDPPLQPLASWVPGGSTKTATLAGDTIVNSLINLPGVSCLQPLREGGPVPRGVPRLLPDKEVWNDGPVK